MLTDFSERRAEAWPGVDLDHLVVHELGDDFAEVTEGNATTWERERYEWDRASGTVTAKTLDSNVWAEGSRWDYRITPVEGGSLGRRPARAVREERQRQADRCAAAGGRARR